MDYMDVYKRLFDATRLAGVVAKMMQKGIVNEGKQVANLAHEDAHHKAMREAKTKADEMVQEILLHALLPDYQDILTLDVEEDTPSQSFFLKQDYEYTLILDPIDGTLDYLHQKDTYSICSAIIHKHDIQVAIVYFPQRDILYGYAKGMGTRIYQNLAFNTKGEILDFKPFLEKPTSIYKNSRVKESVCNTFAFENIIDDSEQHLGCPDAIAKCMRGEALAYVCCMRNIRDILLGAIMSKMEHGHAYDFKGNPIIWNAHGRQAEAVFSIYSAKDIFSL